MGKTRAFLVHLAVSGAIATALVAAAAWLWFPLPYFVVDGGWQGIRLVAAIDVVLGPCLTLVVYNRSKSRRALAFDYLVIALLQVSALGFGIWTVFSQRTVVVVLADGVFYTVDAETAVRLGDKGAAVIRSAPTRPAYGFIAMPEDLEAQQVLRRESLSTRRPLYLFAELLEPLDAAATPVLGRYALNPEAMVAGSPISEGRLRKFLENRHSEAMNYLFLPAVSRYGGFLLVFSEDSPVPVGWLDVEVRPPYKRRQSSRRWGQVEDRASSLNQRQPGRAETTLLGLEAHRGGFSCSGPRCRR
ncbi:MAG: hypothetical protein IH608_11035 [Proteobacteria bacterium]|nr:hypothetical protein [Pseudomonadota bacterium]